MSGPARWWEADSAGHRFVVDLVAGELGRLRPGGQVPARPWSGDLSLTGPSLDCDSLEILSLATAVAEAVQMHRAGIEDYLLARRTVADWVAIVAASLESFSSELTFQSSGSTGAPTPCTHALGDLIEEITELGEQFPGRRRLLCAVPVHHIYGFLFGVLLPEHLGIPVIDVYRSSTARLAGDLRAGDLLVGHPAFWASFARTVPRVPADVLGVTSTAPCPPDLARAVVDQGLARLVEVYGSSETSGIGWRSEPDGEYRLLSHWRRAGTASSIIRTLSDGADRAHSAPDRLVWSDARQFQITGRHDGAVQVGGSNVFPSAVSARLCEHPAVRAAAVRAMRPDEGFRLKAFIVPAAGRSDMTRLSAELTAWCNSHLTVAERPKSFTFGPALPHGALGKASDWSIQWVADD